LRLHHFEHFSPVCPRCRSEVDGAPLVVADATGPSDDEVDAGILHCTNDACRQEYPVIDGIPIITPDVRTVLNAQANHINQRLDLGASLTSLLGDVLGDASEFHMRRQHLSIYGWDGYGEFAGAEASPGATTIDFEGTGPAPGAASRALARGLEMLGGLEGPVIDLGCAVGRTTYDLAAETDAPVLGVDLSFLMLQLAHQVLRAGTASFELRHGGLVYHPIKAATPFAGTPNADFWLSDAMSIPLRPGKAGTIVALNLLDCVPSPLALLETIRATLRPGGRALIGCPYDWASSATPPEQWIGGHSQRGGYGGESDALLRALLTPGAHPQSLNDVTILGEAEVEWQTRLHARSITQYRVHLIALEKRVS
jgi:SAM-dependent methyltransferase/uncharacterized protein YbaR (Trm112 family)